jgi:hypothetical protein
MKTTCYCIYCKHHPLFEQRNELSTLTGWTVGKMIYKLEYVQQGKEVDCLEPVTDAYDYSVLDLNPIEEYEFETTAYNDGCSETGFEINGDGFDLKVYACCKNETYE